MVAFTFNEGSKAFSCRENFPDGIAPPNVTLRSFILHDEFDVKCKEMNRIIMITLSHIENAKQMITNACETDQLCFKFTRFDLISN